MADANPSSTTATRRQGYRRRGPLALGIALAGLFLAIGIGVGAFILGQSLIEMRQGGRVVTVKGLSEREVEADVATWRLPFRGAAETREQAIQEAAAARDSVTAFALAGGLAGEELSVEPFTLNIERTYLNVPGGQEERLRYIGKYLVDVPQGNAYISSNRGIEPCPKSISPSPSFTMTTPPGSISSPCFGPMVPTARAAVLPTTA